VDGANAWRRFNHVTIPMLTPTIFFVVILSIIASYQVFTNAFVMTEGGPGSATLMLVLLLYRVAFEQFKFGYASAIAWLIFAIIMVFSLLVIRSSSFWVYYAGDEQS
jgi:multiple sugar transport system permease protein